MTKIKDNARVNIVTVQSGDRIKNYAKKAETSIWEIQEDNKNLNPDKIKVGDKILLEYDEDAEYAKIHENDEEYFVSNYTIQKGETLAQIAKREGVNVDILMAFNPDIEDINSIVAGAKLAIPKSAQEQEAAVQTPINIEEAEEKSAAETTPENVPEFQNFLSQQVDPIPKEMSTLFQPAENIQILLNNSKTKTLGYAYLQEEKDSGNFGKKTGDYILYTNGQEININDLYKMLGMDSSGNTNLYSYEKIEYLYNNYSEAEKESLQKQYKDTNASLLGDMIPTKAVLRINGKNMPDFTGKVDPLAN